MSNYKENWLFVGQGAGFQAVEANTGIFKALEELKMIPGSARASSGSALFCSLYYSGWDSKRFEIEEDNSKPLDWVEACCWQTTKTPLGKSNYCFNNEKIHHLLFREMNFNATERVQVSVTRMDDYSTHMKPATPDWATAAGSIPFVLPTLKKEGSVWGDGGIFNNIPLPSIEECKQYEKIILFLAPKTELDGKALGIKGIAHLILATMCREEHSIEKAGYEKELGDKLIVIQPESPHGGHLFKWSNNFALRKEAYNLTLKELTK